jgi:hypothetical protein
MTTLNAVIVFLFLLFLAFIRDFLSRTGVFNATLLIWQRLLQPTVHVQRVLFQHVLAVNKRIPVLVGNEERISLQEVHVDGLTDDARHVSATDVLQLIFAELQKRVGRLEPESIAELPVPELLGNDAFF